MKPEDLLLKSAKTASAIRIVGKADVAKLAKPARAWAETQRFEAAQGQHLVVPDTSGGVAEVLFAPGSDPFLFARLARALPAGIYKVEGDLPDARNAILAYLLESYSFGTYKRQDAPGVRLVCPAQVDRARILSAAASAWLVRDLVNTPSNDLGPAELEQAARKLAREFGVQAKVTAGKPLEKNFPMIHAVGKASPRAPRLIDFNWGNLRAPRVTLVGKGVCFDTGGLDIKPSSGMLLMKKDMGGAANVLGLARMIMAAKLPVRLRVLIPAVENAIAGNAFRPGDILRSRKGLTVEIGNTDAEGRLVLADALALADEEAPDLLIDMATLTGAARVALGPDLPPLYCDDDQAAERLVSLGRTECDPLWRMPFWQPYLKMMESPIADINNASESSFAGSITAALFMKRFVEKAKCYIHLDVFAWTPSAKPGRPKGGEAQGIRALFEFIRERYSK